MEVIRSPRVSTKLINSILDDFFLFDNNEFEDLVLSSITVGECMELDLKKLRRCQQRQREDEEARRRAFEMRQRWLPLEELESG